jgi:hypothetical protein
MHCVSIEPERLQDTGELLVEQIVAEFAKGDGVEMLTS